jgi:Uma2 family endonuclease
MATVTRKPRSGVVVLRQVPYEYYVQLTNASANRHLRMAYHDGTLEIVSPGLRQHEEPSVWFRWIVAAICRHRRIRFKCTAGTTFRRGGGAPLKGSGKEADESYYLANVGRLPVGRDPDLEAGDPPPDLWIEVDHRVSSKGRLPVYAKLGVPEVWRYRSKSKKLEFLRLVDGSYETIDQSLGLPMLTPSLALEALALGENADDLDLMDRLDDWVRRTFPID